MNIPIASKNEYLERHIGPREKDRRKMLQTIGVASMDEMINKTIPADIRLKKPLDIPDGISEFEFTKHLQALAARNMVFKSYIGMGYYNTIVPAVIQRNIFENPGWYTQYTPYQAEIAQGRLEALLNYQTMVMDLTAMEVANASLLDEATAAAEAMAMLYRSRTNAQIKNDANVFLVSKDLFPQTLDLLKTRSKPMNIELHIGDHKSFSQRDGLSPQFSEKVFAAILQYPCDDGRVEDYSAFIASAHQNDIRVVVATDLLALTLLTPPGEMGADVVVGSSQRFGVPMGYGGPHAAFLATRNDLKRQVPGRIIGVSIDRHGNPGYRMALQTREQHIRGEKATSNICTAQSLLAIMASMYAVYHGPDGIKQIAARVHAFTRLLANGLTTLGYSLEHSLFFDTIRFSNEARIMTKAYTLLLENQINTRRIESNAMVISLDEATGAEDVINLLKIFAIATGQSIPVIDNNIFKKDVELEFPDRLLRTTSFLTHPVFNTYRSETQMMRYIKSLENKDLSLNTSMIPLGSCTMKLNPATAMMPVSWPAFSQIHPFVPLEQVSGYTEIISDMEKIICTISGLSAASLQPNSGAQGEYTGLMTVRAYYADKGEEQRNVVLVPTSAHGTNPASASMAGMRVVLVKCDDNGNVDVEDLKTRAEQHKSDLAAFMITYPSTHGVFEEGIRTMVRIVHENGGQVYMDGANMNAQVGLTSPGEIGADVCHLNLHKTFSIPHGGGGPGMGPIAVAKHLAPFLPGHPVIKTGGEKAITAVSATPWGSSSILLISYAYMKMLGGNGMRNVTEHAILNANYIRARLSEYFKVLYTGKNGFVGHEMIVDLRDFKNDAGVDVEDIAKRLIDYGFHAPTVSWPVHGTIMVEPTESESKDELDRFCNALISIYHEVQEIKVDGNNEDNVLKNAPHTAAEIASDSWNHPYSRQKAAYPAHYLKHNKFWPAVARINNTYGDRNLVCACPPVENYVDVE